jgi:hypothetical protein
MAVSIDDIRVYTKDIPELNILLEGEEQSSEDLILLAERLTVSDFNSLPPMTVFQVKNFPSDVVLLYGILYHLAVSESEKQLRNQVTFQTQGMHASIDDKHSVYLQLAQTYKAMFTAQAKEMKQQMNMSAAWGGSFSPYIYINDLDFKS